MRTLLASMCLFFGITRHSPDADARQVRNTTRVSVSRSANVNVHRDIDVDVDHGHYHPVARAAGVAAAATVTAVAIGSIVHSLPPSCTTIVNGGVTYQQCGSTWYQPRYAGTQVTYVVVNPP